jgi:type II secretory pathway pseudopilin PulG
MRSFTLLRSFSGQSGAMFGMDARVALIVMAILAGVGGWQMMSRLESNKTDQAEAQSAEITQGLAKYYATIGISRLPENLEELFRSNVLTNPSLRKDPWGNPWEYYHISALLRIEDTPITVQFAVVFSRGKNTIDDTGGFSSLEEFGGWETKKDDLGSKFTTRETDLKRLDDYRARASLIIDKLEATESANFLEAQGSCNGTEAPAWCTDLEGKNYTLFNYYPKTDADDTSGVVYYTDKVLSKRLYSSGNLDDMQQLMIDLGLPASFAQDPWGRVLMINPNITQRTDPPYSASLCFSAGENCLSRREE